MCACEIYKERVLTYFKKKAAELPKELNLPIDTTRNNNKTN